MNWFAFSVPLAIAFAVALLPGLIALTTVRLSPLTRFAAAGPVSVACVGIAGVVSGFTHGGFSLWMVLAIAIAAAAALWLCQNRPSLRFPRPAALKRRMARIRTSIRHGRLSAGAWLAASAFLGIITFCAVDSPTLFPQTYDNIFHINGVMWILNTGDASSLDFRQLIEPDRASFYPSGWHSLAALVAQLTQLTGVASPNEYSVLVPVAMNAMWLAVASAVWLPGIAWLTRLAVAAPAARLRRWIAPLALALGASVAAMPYAMLSYGTLSPMFLAYAVTPALVGFGIVLARRWWPGAAPGAGKDLREDRLYGVRMPTLVALFLAVGGAICFAQPRALPTAALILGMFLLATAARAFHGAWLAGGRRRRKATIALGSAITALLAIAAVAWLVIYRVFDVANRPISDHLNGPQAKASQEFLSAIANALLQVPNLGGSTPALPAAGVAIALIAGMLWALRGEGLRWLAFAEIAAIFLYALASGSDSVFAKLATGLWYKDAFRLNSLVAMLAIPLIVLAFERVAQLLASRPQRRRRLALVATATLVLASAVVSLVASVPQEMATVFALTSDPAKTDNHLIDQRQTEFLADVAAIVPAEERILNDPWDGSALSWLYSGREPVFPHVNGYWDTDRSLLLNDLDEIDTDPAVCAALDRLNAHYVLYNPGAFLGGDPAGNAFGSVHAAVEAGLFTDVVATDGTNVLYRIDQCD